MGERERECVRVCVRGRVRPRVRLCVSVWLRVSAYRVCGPVYVRACVRVRVCVRVGVRWVECSGRRGREREGGPESGETER